MITVADLETAGRQAYLSDEPAAPALNPAVMTAITDLPVGQGAAEIMKAFTRGYEQERTAELARLGF